MCQYLFFIDSSVPENDVDVKDIKALITAVGYGSRGHAFKEKTGKPVMPEVLAMRTTMIVHSDASYSANSERDRLTLGGRKGRSTALSVFG